MTHLNPPTITLTTDFGWRDPYVAAMKGVLRARAPEARIDDLTHEIPPQDVLAGAFFVAGAAPWFPPGTIHVVVVDPGVGTTRRAMAARAGGQIFVCPDNGLLTLLAQAHPIEAARAIENPDFMAEAISPTFHGRDVFAPAAARLALGAPLDEAGPPIAAPVMLDAPRPETAADGGVTGAVLSVDRFGNAITNIPARMLPRGPRCAVRAGGLTLSPIRSTYGETPSGAPLALVGSAGYLEIAVRDGDAATAHGLTPGAPVTVTPAE